MPITRRSITKDQAAKEKASWEAGLIQLKNTPLNQPPGKKSYLPGKLTLPGMSGSLPLGGKMPADLQTMIDKQKKKYSKSAVKIASKKERW